MHKDRAEMEEYMDKPTLTFDVAEEPAVPVVVEKAVPQENQMLEEAQLSPEEKQMVMEFVDKIENTR